MYKKALLVFLLIAFIIEALIGVVGIISQNQLLALFKYGISQDTIALAYIIAWLALFVSYICGIAIKQVINNNRNGWLLSYSLAIFWIILGIAVFIKSGRPDNLFIDTFKGCLILISAYLSRNVVKTND